MAAGKHGGAPGEVTTVRSYRRPLVRTASHCQDSGSLPESQSDGTTAERTGISEGNGNEHAALSKDMQGVTLS